MPPYCNVCGNEISENDNACANCGAMTPSQTQSLVKVPKREKSNRKIVVTISIIAIVAIILIALLFILWPQGDISNFVGKWNVSGQYISDQVWIFNSNGGILIIQSYNTVPTSLMDFTKDDIENNLMVDYCKYSEVSEESRGIFELEGNKICITVEKTRRCFDYNFYNNYQTLELRGDTILTLEKAIQNDIYQEEKIEIEILLWDNFMIIGDCNTSSLGEFVMNGDVITDC